MDDRASWDQMYMNMCYEVALRSPDESTKSGCYIASTDNTPISFGYNGFPRGLENKPERQQRPIKYQYFEHAERNAIYNAGREGKSCVGAKLYINWSPCSDCTRAIIQSGIAEVIVHSCGQRAFKMSRNDDNFWDDDHNIFHSMLEEAGVAFRWFDGDIRTGLWGVWSGKRYTFVNGEPRELDPDAKAIWAQLPEEDTGPSLRNMPSFDVSVIDESYSSED